MAKLLYRGFTTQRYYNSKQDFRLSNIDVVKKDLLNHIYTRRGERVMMPDFGTMIPDLMFEPLDKRTVDTVAQELRYVFEYDPRVQLIDLSVFPVYDDNLIIGSAVLHYIELNLQDRLDIHIEMTGTTK